MGKERRGRGIHGPRPYLGGPGVIVGNGESEIGTCIARRGRDYDGAEKNGEKVLGGAKIERKVTGRREREGKREKETTNPQNGVVHL